MSRCFRWTFFARRGEATFFPRQKDRQAARPERRGRATQSRQTSFRNFVGCLCIGAGIRGVAFQASPTSCICDLKTKPWTLHASLVITDEQENISRTETARPIHCDHYGLVSSASWTRLFSFEETGPSGSIVSLEQPPAQRHSQRTREKKEFNRSRRRSKKNVKSTDTHRGVLEALEESRVSDSRPSLFSFTFFFFSLLFFFLPFDRRRTDRTGRGDAVWEPRGERQKVEIMSSENGPDATYASVEKIIGFAGCVLLYLRSSPQPLCLHLLVHRIIVEKLETMIRFEITGNLKIHHRECVIWRISSDKWSEYIETGSVLTRYLTDKE